MRRCLSLGILLLGCLCLAAAKLPAEQPWYVDDDKLADNFSAKLIELAKQGKCLSPQELQKKLTRTKCKVAWKSPGHEALTPEEVYRRALPGVFVLGSVQQPTDHAAGWQGGRLATAWAVTEDGVLATNWHVFDKVGKECYGVVNFKGEVFPVIDFLGCDRTADIALIRVAGKGFTPLPLAADESVGAWVGVLGHPGNQFFTFTQGHVTRYTTNIIDGKDEKWMSLSADFAYGSSGAPVLNRFGAVVGMAAITTNIDYPLEPSPEEQPPEQKPQGDKDHRPPQQAPEKAPAKTPEKTAETALDKTCKKAPEKTPAKTPEKIVEKPADKAAEKPSEQAAEPEGSLVQMVVKLAVPGRTIQEFCAGEKAAAAPVKAPAK